MAQHILSVLVADPPGVLARVTALLTRRGFTIDSIAEGATEHPDISRMTIVVNGEEDQVEQAAKQLAKLIDVLRVVRFEPGEALRRELVLAKVRADHTTRGAIVEIVNLFQATVVDVHPDLLTIEATGTGRTLDALLALLQPYGITELVQSGAIAIGRGPRVVDLPSVRSTAHALAAAA
jgi:acetolactate synthase-1/3 small subunit